MINTIFRIADQFAFDKEVIAIKQISELPEQIMYMATCKDEENKISVYMIQGGKNDKELVLIDNELLGEYEILNPIQTQEGKSMLKDNDRFYRAFKLLKREC